VSERVQKEALHDAIAQLPKKQQRWIKLYFFDKLTFEQIAKIDGCKYQTV